MTRRSAALFSMSCLLAAPMLAQTTIGGGTCTSASLMGVYSVSVTGRQVTAAGAFTSVFQANGIATFDGLSQITASLVANTPQGVGSPITWAGTYSVQANCLGIVNLTTGATATMNLALYDGGTDFLLSGSDSHYTYAGGGNTQPAACSAGNLSGVYTFSGTGFALTSGAVTGIQNGSGLLQFDGVGSVTVNVTMSLAGAAPQQLTLTGSYTVGANCLGSTTLTDASYNSYAISISVYSATAFYVGLAQNSKFLITGSGHAAYGQPVANAAAGRTREKLASVTSAKGGRA